MKTLAKSVIATLLTAVIISSSAVAGSAASPVKSLNPGKSTSVKGVVAADGFNKIWVAGNVKIILTQNVNEGVFVDEDFNADKTSIIGKGQTLYINSMEGSQVTIRVSVKDLQRIEAAGSAEVVTSNNFDVKYLQLFLSQSAKAKVSAITGSLYTVISDDAVLKMSGAADEHTLIASNIKNVKFNNFVSLKTNGVASDLAMTANQLTANKAK